MATYRITSKRKAFKGTGADDVLVGSKFKEIFNGLAGDDFISADDGNDDLTGGEGNDTIYGGAGSDRAMGGLGKDELFGGLGSDKLYGGDGADSLFGADGNDTLYGDAGRDYLYGADGNDKLYGGTGNDYLSGDLGNDRLEGGDGDDQMDAGDGDDRLDGGTGDDYLYGNKGNDRLDGGRDDDNLYGGSGSDYLSGGAGDDFLDGSDPLYPLVNGVRAPKGQDRLLGGDGNDTIVADDGDNALGGKGVDTLSLSIERSSSDPITAYAINLSRITGKKAVDIGYHGIKAGQFEKVHAEIDDMDVGSVIAGTKGNDTINAYGKSGVINGGAGNDDIYASAYNDDNPANGIIVNGGAGDDKLRGSGDVTLVGGAGDDQFILSRSAGCTIADFSGKDYFLVRGSTFQYYDSALSKTVTPAFDRANPLVVGADPKPTTTLAQFFYDTDDGKLYYDADGIGTNFELRLVATLANKAALKAADFVFVL